MKRVAFIVLSLVVATSVGGAQEKAAGKKPPPHPATTFYQSSNVKEVKKLTRMAGFQGDVLVRKGATLSLAGGEGTCFVEPGAKVSTIGGVWALIVKQGGVVHSLTGGKIHIYAEKNAEQPFSSAGPFTLDEFAAITFASLEPFSLQGSVREASGKACAGIHVRAYTLGGNLLTQTITDDKGAFTLRCTKQVRCLAAEIGVEWKKKPALGAQADLDFLHGLHALRGWETDIREGFWGRDAAIHFVHAAHDGVALPAPICIQGHELPIQAMAFSGDSSCLASVSMAGRPCVWNVKTGHLVRAVQPPRNQPWSALGALHPVHRPDAHYLLALDSAGTSLAFGAPGVDFGLWKLGTGERLCSFAGPKDGVSRIAFSPDGRTVAGGESTLRGRDRQGRIRLWATADGKERQALETKSYAFSGLCFAPDGGHLLSTGINLENRSRTFEKTPRVRLWNLASGEEVRTFDGEVNSLRFSADGKRLAGIGFRQQFEDLPNGGYRSGPEYHAFVWDYASGRRRMKGLTRADTCAFAHGGLLLLTASPQGLSLWEVDSGQKILECPLPQRDICQLAFAPDGRTLAVGQQDGTVYLWDIRAHHLFVPGDQKRGEAEWAKLWEALAAGEAATAYRAVWTLLAEPSHAVKLMKQHLRPAPARSMSFAEWIAELDSDDFHRRQEAEKSLHEAGTAAEDALCEARDGKPTLEARRRIDMLLKDIAQRRLVPSAEELRALRAIQLLVEIDSPEARELLHSLAGGWKESRQTREAQAALKRLR